MWPFLSFSAGMTTCPLFRFHRSKSYLITAELASNDAFKPKPHRYAIKRRAPAVHLAPLSPVIYPSRQEPHHLSKPRPSPDVGPFEVYLPAVAVPTATVTDDDLATCRIMP